MSSCQCGHRLSSCLLGGGALLVVDGDAHVPLLAGQGRVVDGVTDLLGDLAALLDGDGHLDGLHPDVLLERAPLLSDVEALAHLLGGDGSPRQFWSLTSEHFSSHCIILA